MELNYFLLSLFIGYLGSLVAGFSMHSKHKDEFNKNYTKYKYLLNMLLIQISVFSIIIFLLVGIYMPLFYYLATIELIILIYFLLSSRAKSRCYKQHRTLIHNFLLIPFVYFSYLVVENVFLLVILILIYVYTILEFQFAKFDPRSPTTWD